MEMITNSFPEYRVMIGRVVSIVVAPPTEIGASFPKVPNSGPLYSVINMLESE